MKRRSSIKKSDAHHKSPRIITGSLKGKRLSVPINGTRPMMDRVKSALFSIINPILFEANVLDMYAGTGALGIECLSRGAKMAVFVDRSQYAISCINDNLDHTGLHSLSKIIKSSVARFLLEYDKFDLEVEKYRIIFVTPPHVDLKESIVERAEILLEKKGVMIVESPTSKPLSDTIGNLEKIDERTYGKTRLSFFMLKE